MYNKIFVQAFGGRRGISDNMGERSTKICKKSVKQQTSWHNQWKKISTYEQESWDYTIG